MRVRSFAEMEQLLLGTSEGSVFLIGGTELYQRNRLESTAIDVCASSSGFEVTRARGSETDAGTIGRLFTQRSLFAPARMIVLEEPDDLSREARSVLLSCVQSMGQNALLVTTDRTRFDNRFYRSLSKTAHLYVCYDPFDWDMPKWAQRLSREEGLRLDGGGASVLQAYASGSLVRLASAIQTLSLYYGPDSVLSRRQVAEVLSGRGDYDIFDLSDSLFSNARAESLAAAWSLLLAGEEPTGLLAYLYAHWQRMCAAREVLSSGGGRGEVAKKLNAGKLLTKKIIEHANRAVDLPLAKAVDLFASTDESLKTGEDPFVAISGLIFALTSRRA